MDDTTRDRVLLKILESLDKIRQNTDVIAQAAKKYCGIPALPKRDHEIDEILGKRKTLGPEIPLDDRI